MSKILIVEPDSLLAISYSMALKNKGHLVTTVKTVNSAVEALDDDLPDLLIIELNIAKHNGLELLYEVRSYQDWVDLKIIVNSFSSEKVGEDWLKEKLFVSEVLTKPKNDLNHFVEKVEGVLINL